MGERSNTPDRRNISLLPVRQMGITKNMLVSRQPDAYRVVATTEGIGLRPYPRLLPRSSLGELKVHIASLSRDSHAFVLENFYQTPIKVKRLKQNQKVAFCKQNTTF